MPNPDPQQPFPAIPGADMTRMPLTQRLESLEQQVMGIMNRLDALEQRVQAIDTRVGGGDGSPPLTGRAELIRPMPLVAAPGQ